MTRRGRGIGIGVAVLLALGSASTASAQATCDRACLRTLLDQYLAAVVKHDPAAVPLVVGFRQTENAINVPPSGGVWKTMTGLGKMQRRYLDAVTGQAGYYGLIEESGTVALATVRLRVQNRKISESIRLRWMGRVTFCRKSILASSTAKSLQPFRIAMC